MVVLQWLLWCLGVGGFVRFGSDVCMANLRCSDSALGDCSWVYSASRVVVESDVELCICSVVCDVRSLRALFLGSPSGSMGSCDGVSRNRLCATPGG